MLKELPHVGNILHQYLISNRITKAECARRLNVKPAEVNQYLKRDSLQMHVIWNFCMALEHDFLSDLQAFYPSTLMRRPDPRNLELEKEISNLKMKVDIYENLLKK